MRLEQWDGAASVSEEEDTNGVKIIDNRILEIKEITVILTAFFINAIIIR